MYAMTHVAIHDALNAIDRRFRPYAYDDAAKRGASADAAVAAAARGVMVPVLGQLTPPFGPECIEAGVASVEADYAAAIAEIPDGRAKTRGIAVGEAAAAAIVALRADDGADTTLIDAGYPQGTAPGEYRFTPDRPFAFAPGWADVTPFVLKSPAQFRPGPPYPVTSRKYAARRQRDPGTGWGRANHAEHSHRRADRDRALLGGKLPAGLEPDRSHRRTLPALGPVGERPTVRAAQHGHGRRLYRLLRHQVPLQLLAPSDGHPRSGHRRQPAHHRRSHVDAAGDHTADPRLRLGPLRRGWGRRGRAGPRPGKPGLVHGMQPDPSGRRAATARSPVLRHFDSFSEAAAENAVSRIYVGFHFRDAVETGVKHGDRIGTAAVKNFMRPA